MAIQIGVSMPFQGEIKWEPGTQAISSAWLINNVDLFPQLVASQMSSDKSQAFLACAQKGFIQRPVKNGSECSGDPGPHLSLCL